MLLDRIVSQVRLFKLFHRTLRHKLTDAQTVGDLIEERTAAHPERPFLYFEDRCLSYGEFNAAANRVAHWARGCGLRAGDRVALLMENRPEFLCAWAGLAKLGVIVPLINPQLRGESLRYVLGAADTTWLLAGAECLRTLATVADAVRDWHMWVWAENDGAVADLPQNAQVLGPVLRDAPTDNPPRAVRAGVLAGQDLVYIFTSGTTGFPKPARMSHMRVLAIGDGMSGVAGYGPGDVIYCPIPLFHGAGGVVVPASALWAGCAMALRRRFSASAFWDDCRRYGVTGVQYVGEICQFLLNQPPQPTDRDHRVRLMMGTGMRTDMWGPFQQRFGVRRIVESYGSTEGNTSIINLDNKPGSVGRVPFTFLHNSRLIRYDVETETHPRDAQGVCIDCAPGEVGELIGRIDVAKDTGAQRFEGYTSAADTERKILRDVFRPGDTWYRSGDLLRRDADDYYYFVDRIGDTFRWKSENVSTQEVAAILNAHPAVEIANVYGVTVPGEPGRAGMAALALKPGTCFDGRAFFGFVSQHLPGYGAPLFVRLRPEADVTGTYKLRKVDLQREGYDPAVVTDPLFIRDEAAAAYVPLTAARAAALGRRTE